MNRLLALAVLIVSVACAPTVRAEDTPPPPPPLPNESIEWLLIARPSIALEVVTNTSAEKNPKTSDLYLTIQTSLKETLKGHPPQQASFVRRWQELKAGQDGGARPDNGTEYLLFFDDQGAVTNAINLKFPSQKLGVGVDPADVAVLADFTILKSGDVIKDVVRRHLAQPPADADAQKPKKVEVPIDTAAWAVFYNGTTSFLLIPGGAQANNEDQPIMRTAEFSGPALLKECSTLPKKAFEIKSALGRQPHTLTITCSQYPNLWDPRKLTVTFKVQDIGRPADYDFHWGTNPDLYPEQKAFFGNEKDCDMMARMIQARPVHDATPLVAAEGVADHAPALVATWAVDCVPSEAWGFSLAFQLHVRYAPKDGLPNNVAAPLLPATK